MPAAPAILGELNRFSAKIGRDIRLVQAGGGNTSVKDGGILWVKSSGAWLADAEDRTVFVPLDLAKIQATMTAGQEDFSGCVMEGATGRPSIETSLHALMPRRIVVHCHSVNTLAWAVQAAGREVLNERLRGLQWLWIDYARPGLALSQAVREALLASPDARVLVLASHGLVLAADTIGEAQALLDEVERRLQLPERQSPAPSLSTLQTLLPTGSRLPAFEPVHALALDPVARRVATSGALYPDHAVFLGTAVPAIDGHDPAGLRQSLEALLLQRPHCAIVGGHGVVLGAECSRTVEAMLACCALVALRLDSAEGINYLSAADVAAIANWDMEKHRIGIQK